MSQQPAAARLENTAERLRNAVPSVVTGLRKRPPLHDIEEMWFAPTTSVATYMLARPTKETRFIVAADGDIKVFTASGVEEPVTFQGSATTYLNQTNPRDNLGFLSIADTVFLYNRNRAVASLAITEDRPDYSDRTSLIIENTAAGAEFTISGDWGTEGETTVTINSTELNQTFTLSGPWGASVSHTTDPVTAETPTQVATSLRTLLIAEGATVTRVGATLTIQDTDEEVTVTPTENTTLYYGGRVSFKVSTTSPEDVSAIAEALEEQLIEVGATVERVNNTLSITDPNRNVSCTPASITRVYRDEIAKFTDLPPYEVGKRIVRVGSPEDTDGSYYVQYNAAKGQWKEVAAWGEKVELDPSTMPHILVDNGDGTWTVKPNTWNSRTTGDADTNANPSFVGFKIQDMFMMSNRLAILADENLICSEVGYYENFYRTTNTTLLDSDRIDIAALNADARIAKLYHAVDFDNDILIFSDEAQFKIDNSSGVSPNTINIQTATNFRCATRCKPVKVGTNILFVDDSSNSEWAAMREYLVDDVVGVSSSDIITKQVPELIPTGVYKMASNSSLGLTVVLTEGDTNLYLYSDFWQRNERIQSAWSFWTFSAEPIDVWFEGNRLWVIYKKADEVRLGYLDLHETISGDVGGLDIMLDYRRSEDEVVINYNSGTDTTNIVVPYPTFDGEEYYIVLTADGIEVAGTALVPVDYSASNRRITFEGDLRGEAFVVGKKYKFQYALSPIFIRDDGNVPIQDGRFQIRYLSILYHKTSYFDVLVTPPGRPTKTTTFTGRTMGSLTNVIGAVPVSDGEFRVPVSTEAYRMDVVIENDSPFNCRFSSIDWEGVWRPKTRRVR